LTYGRWRARLWDSFQKEFMAAQTEKEKYQLIRQAILERKQIIAKYKSLSREMCPHSLGHKDGFPHVLFYQFGGSSSSRRLGPSGDGANWRCMFVSELDEVSIRDGDWHTAPNHSRPNTCVDDVDVEI
jgi:hypothetical protein